MPTHCILDVLTQLSSLLIIHFIIHILEYDRHHTIESSWPDSYEPLTVYLQFDRELLQRESLYLR